VPEQIYVILGPLNEALNNTSGSFLHEHCHFSWKVKMRYTYLMKYSQKFQVSITYNERNNANEIYFCVHLAVSGTLDLILTHSDFIMNGP